MRSLPSSKPSKDLLERFFQAINALHSGHASSASTLRAEDLMKKLQLLQVDLRELVAELVEHQQLNEYIERLNRDNATYESKLLTLSGAFREGESTLQSKIDELKDSLMENRRTNKHPVNVDDVVSYGSKIGPTISAPFGWDPTQPLGNYMRPAPSHEMMHAGRLAAMSQKSSGDSGMTR